MSVAGIPAFLEERQVLQRERDLESRVYDGRRTVDLELDDVRPGDVLEFAYTLAGQNPVFGDHHAGGFAEWQCEHLCAYPTA